VGYRAEYLLSLAKRCLEDPSLGGIEGGGIDFQNAFGIVRQLKGFGPYASAHVLVLAGFFEAIPVDSVVLGYVRSNYRARKPESFLSRHYRAWGKYAWWGMKLEKILRRQNWLGD